MSVRAERFRELHRDGLFVMPNPWDVGSARLFESMGFAAVATTSSGHAATLGRDDGEVELDELVEHVGQLAAAVEIPLSVDLEWGFAPEPDGLDDVFSALARAGAAGCSLEDFDPRDRTIMPVGVATDRVRAGAEAAARHGLLLTARAENHIRGHPDLDDTIDRLASYLEAGADALYAPGLADADDIARVVALGAPVNVLARPGAPTIAELADLGVRRVSTGGALARVAVTAARTAAQELLDDGTYGYFQRM